MTISEAVTKQFKDRVLFADVECYNSDTCMTEYLKGAQIKVTHVNIFEDGENTLYAIVLDGDRAGKECNMFFGLETEFNFID